MPVMFYCSIIHSVGFFICSLNEMMIKVKGSEEANYLTIIYLPFKFTSSMFCRTPFVLDNSSRIVLTSCKRTNLKTKI